jgi:hypothetical protein
MSSSLAATIKSTIMMRVITTISGVSSIMAEYQHFHRRNANAFRVGLPFESFIGPFTPFILAQNERFLGPPPGCGRFNLDPVLRL